MPMDWRQNVVILPHLKLAWFTCEKNASTATRAMMREALTVEGERWQDTRDRIALLMADPSELADWPDYLSACMARDPFERLLSCYANKILRQRVLLRKNQIGLREHMPFDEFVRRVCNAPDERLDRHLWPQTKRWTNEAGLIPQHIFYVEDLPEAWQEWRGMVREHCGLELPDLPVMNASEKPPNVWTPELRQLVRQKYASDFELLGFD